MQPTLAPPRIPRVTVSCACLLPDRSAPILTRSRRFSGPGESVRSQRVRANASTDGPEERAGRPARRRAAAEATSRRRARGPRVARGHRPPEAAVVRVVAVVSHDEVRRRRATRSGASWSRRRRASGMLGVVGPDAVVGVEGVGLRRGAGRRSKTRLSRIATVSPGSPTTRLMKSRRGSSGNRKTTTSPRRTARPGSSAARAGRERGEDELVDERAGRPSGRSSPSRGSGRRRPGRGRSGRRGRRRPRRASGSARSRSGLRRGAGGAGALPDHREHPVPSRAREEVDARRRRAAGSWRPGRARCASSAPPRTTSRGSTGRPKMLARGIAPQ